MDVALYWSHQGSLLLVPACMHPSRAAERLHGPLVLCARTQLARVIDPLLRERVEHEIDRHAFALLSQQEVQHVLGRRHACFRKRPHALLQRIRARARVVPDSAFI